MIRLAHIASWASVAVSLVACSASSNGTISDAGTSDGATAKDAASPSDSGAGNDATSGDDAGGTCNALANSASDVPITVDTVAIPTGTGGTIADGTYHITEVRTYQGSPLTALTFNQTIVISGTGMHYELVANDSDKPEFHESATITSTPSGTISIDETCTTEQNYTPIPYTSFTASGTTLQVFCASYGFSITLTLAP
jgi:hypothetical protein